MKLDCSACKNEKTMEQSKVGRFSTVVRVIGYIFLVPSVLGMIAAVIMFIGAYSAVTESMTLAQTEATRAGVALGASIGVGVAIFFGIASFVGGLLGWLLLMKRKVYKCIKCGFILDRA